MVSSMSASASVGWTKKASEVSCARAAPGSRSAGPRPAAHERLLAVELGARAVLDGRALGGDGGYHAVAVPAVREALGLDLRVEAVEGVLEVLGRQGAGDPGHAGKLRQPADERAPCAARAQQGSSRRPDARHRGFELRHAVVGAEAVVRASGRPRRVAAWCRWPSRGTCRGPCTPRRGGRRPHHRGRAGRLRLPRRSCPGRTRRRPRGRSSPQGGPCSVPHALARSPR